MVSLGFFIVSLDLNGLGVECNSSVFEHLWFNIIKKEVLRAPIHP